MKPAVALHLIVIQLQLNVFYKEVLLIEFKPGVYCTELVTFRFVLKSSFGNLPRPFKLCIQQSPLYIKMFLRPPFVMEVD